MNSYEQDPDDNLDYTVDWTSFLASGETITASEWIVPADLTETSPANDGTTATVWLAGGDAGYSYTVTNRITTSDDRTKDRSFVLVVKEQ